MKRESKSNKGYGRRIFATVVAFTLLGTGVDAASVVKAAESKVKLQNPRTSEVRGGGLDTVSGLRNPRVKMKVRDTVTFGSYWQEDTNGDGVADQKDEKQPIKWQVLSVDGDDVFLMADKILDQQKYHTSSDDASLTWGNSYIRQWLNGEFYNAAFDAEERSAIKETTVTTKGRVGQIIYDGGEEKADPIDSEITTKDKIYLLSPEEMVKTEYGFKYGDISSSGGCDGVPIYSDQARTADCTSYALPSADSLYGDCYLLRSYADSMYLDESDENYIKHSKMKAGYVSGTTGTGDDLRVRLGGDGDCIYGCLVSELTGIRPVLHLDASLCPELNKDSVETALAESEWDVVELGKWRNEPIKWRVLSSDQGDAFLLSNEVLAQKGFHNTNEEHVTWEKSTLRAWLNGSFYADTFTEQEKRGIKRHIWKSDSISLFADVENDTEDLVSLPSGKDMIEKKYGFPTYTGESGTRVTGGDRDYYNYSYWLRSPGLSSVYANLHVAYNTREHIDSCGGNVYGYESNKIEDLGVRPVLHYDLANFSLKKVGTVRATIDTEGQFSADSTLTTVGNDKNDQPGNNPSNPSATGQGQGTSGGNNQKTEGNSGGNSTQSQGSKDLNKNIGSDSKPGKVTSLQGKNNKKKAVTLSWKKTAKAKKYQIQYSRNKKFKKAKTKTTTKVSYKVAKLKKKETYYFRVRAVSKTGKKGAWSKTVKVKIKK